MNKTHDLIVIGGGSAGLVEPHNAALADTIKSVRTKLLGAELLVKLRKIDLPEADFEQAKSLARSAADTVQRGKLGYALIVTTQA